MKTSLLLAGIVLVSAPVTAAAQTDLGPLNLPIANISPPWTEGFEIFGGTIPQYIALTNLDAATLTADPDAWCNLGQLGPCLQPFDGQYNLEMGLLPGSTNYHNVRNAMVMGIDPTLYTGDMTLSAVLIDGGEETGVVDGIWVSSDGQNWYALETAWGTLIGPLNEWESTSLIALDSTPVDTTQPFYLAFVQEDNFPYLDLDGIGVDNINIPGVPPPPILADVTLNAGLYATLQLTSGYPNRPCKFLASKTGGGPTTVQGVDLALSPPILELAEVQTATDGSALHSVLVPAALAGAQVWLQSVIILPAGGGAITSNGRVETVL